MLKAKIFWGFLRRQVQTGCILNCQNYWMFFDSFYCTFGLGSN